MLGPGHCTDRPCCSVPPLTPMAVSYTGHKVTTYALRTEPVLLSPTMSIIRPGRGFASDKSWRGLVDLALSMLKRW